MRKPGQGQTCLFSAEKCTVFTRQKSDKSCLKNGNQEKGSSFMPKSLKYTQLRLFIR